MGRVFDLFLLTLRVHIYISYKAKDYLYTSRGFFVKQTGDGNIFQEYIQRKQCAGLVVFFLFRPESEPLIQLFYNTEPKKRSHPNTKTRKHIPCRWSPPRMSSPQVRGAPKYPSWPDAQFFIGNRSRSVVPFGTDPNLFRVPRAGNVHGIQNLLHFVLGKGGRKVPGEANIFVS